MTIEAKMVVICEKEVQKAITRLVSKEAQREANRELKLTAISEYPSNKQGGCNIEGCKHNAPIGLVLHHTLNNGRAHRELLGCTSGLQFLIRLRAGGWKNDSKYPIEVLCGWHHEIKGNLLKQGYKDLEINQIIKERGL